MKQKKILTCCIYVLFLLLIVAAFVVSDVIISKETIENVEKEDFLILKDEKEISSLLYDGIYVWVGGIDGVTIYNVETKEEVKKIEGLMLLYSAEMTKTPDGMIWIGHEDGLTGIMHNSLENRIDFKYPDIPKGRVNTVEWDGEKLWIGTYNGAASLIPDENSWKVESIYNKNSGLCSDSVNVICKTEDSIWFASYLDAKSGGISIVDNGEIKHITIEDGIPHPYITSMQYLGQEKMLVGTGYMDTGGLALVEKIEDIYTVTDTFFMKDGIPGEKVRQVFLDSEGLLWITTEYDGILITDYKNNHLNKPLSGLYYTEKNGLSDNEIKCIVETPQEYWLGGKYGLTVIPKSIINKKLP